MITRWCFAVLIAAFCSAEPKGRVLPGPEGSGLQTNAPSGTTRIPQFENEHVKVWKSVKESGQTTVAHWETGKAYWLPPDPPGEMHKDINDTGKTIEVMVVEMK